MLVEGYEKEIFRPECNPNFQSLHCIARLDRDIGAVLPYLNAELGGIEYIAEPPSVTFRVHGKLITVHSRKIAVNALNDSDEADKILEWLKGEINDIWERRDEIEPRFTGQSKPQIIEILKRLPKTNCGECGQPTCMVFAVQAADGAKDARDCPPMNEPDRIRLEEYLKPFSNAMTP